MSTFAVRRLIGLLLLAVSTAPVWAIECGCDHSQPATLEKRECSLCREAEKQTEPIFFLKDANPRKPNRTLVLPRKHGKGPGSLSDLTADERVAFWKAAIARAQELWPDAWGVALNAETVRTQCHLHAHIGKLLDGVEESSGRLITTPEQVPVPDPDAGLWFHPAPGGIHLHKDRDTAELVLMR